jgi:hypothetical protein
MDSLRWRMLLLGKTSESKVVFLTRHCAENQSHMCVCACLHAAILWSRASFSLSVMKNVADFVTFYWTVLSGRTLVIRNMSGKGPRNKWCSHIYFHGVYYNVWICYHNIIMYGSAITILFIHVSHCLLLGRRLLATFAIMSAYLLRSYSLFSLIAHSYIYPYNKQMFVGWWSLAVKGLWASWDNIYECLCCYNSCHDEAVKGYWTLWDSIYDYVCLLL